MADIEALNKEISDYGIATSVLAQKAGMNYRNLYNKLHGKGDFTVTEAGKIANVLRLTPKKTVDIFLT